MSLLLDALKKAADDKEKNKKESQDIKQQAVEEKLDNLDLELEMDDFPEVDEGLTKKEQTVNNNLDDAIQDEIVEEITKSVGSIEAGDAEAERELAEYDSIDDIQEDVEIEGAESALRIENIVPVTEAAPKATNSELNNERRRPSPAKLDSTIQMDAEALDALINKSNNQSKKSKMQRTILYVIAIVILLIGTGLYFFLEVTQSTESIYTAGTTTQQRADYIQRNSDEENLAEIETPVIAEQAEFVTAHIEPAKPKQKAAVSAVKPAKPAKKEVTIIHKKVDDPTDQLLRRAYQAFNDGDYVTARQLYEVVLEKENKNKDALLGVAAVAVKEQRLDYAKQKYLQLLYLDPKDSYAKAGLSTVESQQNMTLSESQIKFMLREQPDAAHLHFALGSLYASNENWPEAQAEFFNAWTKDNSNPDYAFNLAVSLDHMDKTKQAIELYQLSIKLLKTGNGNFSKDDVQNRIGILMNAAEKTAN